MTTYAISMYNFPARLFNKDNLWLLPQREDSRMPHAVLCLKIILIQDIIMRNMAIVTIGNFPVGTMKPGRILRRHDMTVHTGFGFIRYIGSGIGNMKSKGRKTNEYS